MKKINIKLKHNFMNIITYRARQNKHVAASEAAPQVGR
jgi:hypothetical protein